MFGVGGAAPRNYASGIWGIAGPMGALDRYVFRTTFGAFLLVLVSLTTVIWLTHALPGCP